MTSTKSKARIVIGVAVILLAAVMTVTLATRHPPQPGDVQKDSWAFAGYASPEAALQTYFWAMNQPDTTNLEASMTVSAQAEFIKGLKDAGQTREQFFKEITPDLKKITGYRILKTQAKTADEMDLQISITGGANKNDWMTIKKAGMEWKVDENPF